MNDADLRGSCWTANTKERLNFAYVQNRNERAEQIEVQKIVLAYTGNLRQQILVLPEDLFTPELRTIQTLEVIRLRQRWIGQTTHSGVKLARKRE